MDTTFPADSGRGWSFDDLLAEGMALVPAYAPGWTQHNPSDPGITLVELFAYVTEILVYRALRVTPDARLAFLRLLDGVAFEGGTPDPATAAVDALCGGRAAEIDALQGGSAVDLEAAIRERARALAQAACAVTPADFEQLAVRAAREWLGGDAPVRAMAMPGVDLRPLEQQDPSRPAGAGDVSVVVAPGRVLPADRQDALLAHVQQQLEPRCLLTSRLHVVRPIELEVGIGCRIALDFRAEAQATLDAIDASLDARFGAASSGDPHEDGPRPFGQPVHLAEVMGAIDRAEGVDHVDDVVLWRVASNSDRDEVEGDGNADGGGSDGGGRGLADAQVGSRIGVRIGRAASVGVDSRLGGVVSLPARRLRLDAAGGVESLALHPWELARVRLAREAVEIVDDEAQANSGGYIARGPT